MDKKILLVDDDIDVREYFKVILESNNFKVEQAENIKDAEELLKIKDIDLIILDVMMEKDSDGFNFAQKLKSDDEFKDIPIAMVTSVNQKTSFNFDMKTDGNFLPVDAFLEKPVSSDNILLEVNKLLN